MKILGITLLTTSIPIFSFMANILEAGFLLCLMQSMIQVGIGWTLTVNQ